MLLHALAQASRCRPAAQIRAPRAMAPGKDTELGSHRYPPGTLPQVASKCHGNVGKGMLLVQWALQYGRNLDKCSANSNEFWAAAMAQSELPRFRKKGLRCVVRFRSTARDACAVYSGISPNRNTPKSVASHPHSNCPKLCISARTIQSAQACVMKRVDLSTKCLDF